MTSEEGRDKTRGNVPSAEFLLCGVEHMLSLILSLSTFSFSLVDGNVPSYVEL